MYHKGDVHRDEPESTHSSVQEIYELKRVAEIATMALLKSPLPTFNLLFRFW